MDLPAGGIYPEPVCPHHIDFCSSTYLFIASDDTCPCVETKQLRVHSVGNLLLRAGNSFLSILELLPFILAIMFFGVIVGSAFMNR